MHFFLLFCVKNHKNTFTKNSHLYEEHMKGRRTDLVNGFCHSVPYINIHRDKTFVITLNGRAIADKILLTSLAISVYYTVRVFD